MIWGRRSAGGVGSVGGKKGSGDDAASALAAGENFRFLGRANGGGDDGGKGGVDVESVVRVAAGVGNVLGDGNRIGGGELVLEAVALAVEHEGDGAALVGVQVDGDAGRADRNATDVGVRAGEVGIVLGEDFLGGHGLDFLDFLENFRRIHDGGEHVAE